VLRGWWLEARGLPQRLYLTVTCGDVWCSDGLSQSNSNDLCGPISDRQHERNPTSCVCRLCHVERTKARVTFEALNALNSYYCQTRSSNGWGRPYLVNVGLVSSRSWSGQLTTLHVADDERRSQRQNYQNKVRVIGVDACSVVPMNPC